MKVYKAIAAVMADLAKVGIAKKDTNTFDNYKFRGIDAVYNALAPLLSSHGLVILPRVLERTSEERVSKKGDALFYITVKAEFDFVAAEDGSKHTVCAYGEAMDRGDKGTNKAMTAAYKYAMFEAFCIPTEGSDDADAETHDVKPAAPQFNGRPMDGVWEAQSADSQAWLLKVAAETVARVANDPDDALDYLASQNLDTDEKAAVASRLDSKTRTALTKAHNAKRKAA
jgi:hypothetical protein